MGGSFFATRALLVVASSTAIAQQVSGTLGSAEATMRETSFRRPFRRRSNSAAR